MLERRNPILLLLLVLFPVFHPDIPAGELYKWTDEEGTVHMTDTLAQVPPQYRDQVDTRRLQATAHPEMKPDAARAGPARAGLRRFEVPYQPFEGTSRRIIIPVTFNESVSAHLLLDTGSPGLMISPDLAGRLGLLDDEQHGNLQVMAAGIGGSVPAVLAVVDTVRVGDARAEFLPAMITKIPSDEFEGLVGMDFMANYRIAIDTKNNVIAFYELPARIDRPGGHDEAWWRSNFRSFANLRNEWGNYLNSLENEDLTSSEKERRARIARGQYEQADNLYRKLERYARDNAVPTQWRQKP